MIHSFNFEQTSPDLTRLDLTTTDEDLPVVIAQLRKLGLNIDENEAGNGLTHVFVGYDD